MMGAESTETNGQSLPSLVDGETLYCWCSKFHMLFGGQTRATGRVLFGAEHACRVVDFPTGLRHFGRHTNGVLGSSEHLLRERTVLSVYWPLLSDESRKAVVHRSENGTGPSISMLIGLIAGQFGSTHPLRKCYICAKEDVEQLGYARWQLRHQLPGVWCCEKHIHPLEAQTETRSIWQLPSAVSFVEAQVFNDRTAHALATVAALLNSFTKVKNLRLDRLIKESLVRIRELGLATTYARLNNKQISSWFDSTYLGRWMRTENVHQRFPKGHWISNYLRGRRAAHPLGVALTWAALHQGEPMLEVDNAFCRAINGVTQPESGRQFDLWSEVKSMSDMLHAPDALYVALRTTSTLKEASQLLGVSVHTVAKWASDDPQLTKEWKRRLTKDRKLLAIKRIEEYLGMTDNMSRVGMLKSCRADVSWLESYAPSVLRRLLDRIPTDRGSQRTLFGDIE